jgi:sulfoxide reductase catalytic subunit YedY
MGSDIKPSEITDEKTYLKRREFILGAGLGIGLAAAPFMAADGRSILRHTKNIGGAPWLGQAIDGATIGEPSTDETPTPYEYVSTYNNFYEFGTGKGDPASNAKKFHTDPWTVEIAGEADITGEFTLEDILSPHALEERIYRLRCVEAWSMVIPWIGFRLGDLIKRFKPSSDAKYVRFETLHDPKQMPGQRSSFASIDYPYVEGLRMDEAMNDLTLLAVGLYGKRLPPQNGAPLRLVVPWKYGFKSIKSIVKIEFTRFRPRTSWEMTNPREYGFYANVNPEVDHPRWSQATERRLPSALFRSNRLDTKMFNGYAGQVAQLYSGMNLKREF